LRRASLAVAVFFAAVGAFAADSSQRLGFIGEGGGYKDPGPAADDYLNQTPPPDGTAPAPTPASHAPAPAAAAAEVAPRPGVPQFAPAAPAGVPDSRSPLSRVDAPSGSAAAARPAVSGRNEGKPGGGQSLWNGLVQPLSMTPSESAEAADPDTARANADRDYETHILGMKSSPARAPLAPRPASSMAGSTALVSSAASARAAGGKVFVSLALDPREAGSLRDAVAGLGVATGFSVDARFEATPGLNGTVLYAGWIPAERIGDALLRPGVKSLRVETRARPADPAGTSGQFLIGLRLGDATRAREGVDAGVRALTDAAGFRLTRVVGLETAPDGHLVAVVAGVLPLSRLSLAMGLSEVAKISPLGGDVPAPAAPPVEPGGVSGFASFAARRGPWLIVLTLLLLLPSLRGPARRAVELFNPYH
jgi:hypothetical protein